MRPRPGRAPVGMAARNASVLPTRSATAAGCARERAQGERREAAVRP